MSYIALRNPATVPVQSPLMQVSGLVLPPSIDVFVIDPQFGLGDAIRWSKR